MKEILGEEWWNRLKGEFDKQYMKDLQLFVQSRRKINIVYPSSENVFRAYQSVPYSKVKVVVLGQD